MNVFVICTGRCGSKTFAMACKHITNYTADHESRIKMVGPERLNYPDNHIEVDNRLTWFLGRLDEKYGDGAYYVHLMRRSEDTAQSLARRHGTGIMRAYWQGICLLRDGDRSSIEVCRDYVYTVEKNIEHFLQFKTKQTTINLKTAKDDFVLFWQRIGAEGDQEAALAEWDHKYNASRRS